VAKGWNVWRLWWELTKLVLTGRGGYSVGVLLDLPDELSDVVNRNDYGVTCLHWVGGEDRFVVLNAEPES
jgi:hypothetical protein